MRLTDAAEKKKEAVRRKGKSEEGGDVVLAGGHEKAEGNSCQDGMEGVGMEDGTTQGKKGQRDPADHEKVTDMAGEEVGEDMGLEHEKGRAEEGGAPVAGDFIKEPIAGQTEDEEVKNGVGIHVFVKGDDPGPQEPGGDGHGLKGGAQTVESTPRSGEESGFQEVGLGDDRERRIPGREGEGRIERTPEKCQEEQGKKEDGIIGEASGTWHGGNMNIR